MAPIPGPDAQLPEVKNLWGTTACEPLGNILNEPDDLFMKQMADVGRCTTAKHPVEVEPGATPIVKAQRDWPQTKQSALIRRRATSWPWGRYNHPCPLGQAVLWWSKNLKKSDSFDFVATFVY